LEGQTGYNISTGSYKYIRDTRVENKKSVTAKPSIETKPTTVKKTELITNTQTYEPQRRETTEIAKYSHSFSS
jgi:uncharacterized protein with WD repeat